MTSTTSHTSPPATPECSSAAGAQSEEPSLVGHNSDGEARRLAQEAADQLIGTAGSLHDNPEWDQDSKPFCIALDELCFCCDRCGWWCSSDELNNDTGEELCDDCNGEDDDEDR